MSLTQCGVSCDVCNKYILPLGEEMINFFAIEGIEQELHCHNACKKVVESCKTWEELPEGRLRKAFEDAAKEQGEVYREKK